MFVATIALISNTLHIDKKYFIGWYIVSLFFSVYSLIHIYIEHVVVRQYISNRISSQTFRFPKEYVVEINEYPNDVAIGKNKDGTIVVITQP